MKYNINPNFYFSTERQSPILSSKGYRVGGILRGFQHTKSGFSEGKGLLGLREWKGSLFFSCALIIEDVLISLTFLKPAYML